MVEWALPTKYIKKLLIMNYFCIFAENIDI